MEIILLHMTLFFPYILCLLNFLPKTESLHLPTTTAATSYKYCHRHMMQKVNNCLFPFDQKYVRYTHINTTDGDRRRMLKTMCKEYERGLMCLHILLQTCPPNRRHTDNIRYRISLVHIHMDKLCFQPTPSTTKMPTTSTTTMSPITKKTELEIIYSDVLPKRLIKSTERFEKTTKYPKRNTTKNTITLVKNTVRPTTESSTESSTPNAESYTKQHYKINNTNITHMKFQPVKQWNKKSHKLADTATDNASSGNITQFTELEVRARATASACAIYANFQMYNMLIIYVTFYTSLYVFTR